MREGEKERDRKEAAGGETKRVCIAAEERKEWVNEWKDEGQRKAKSARRRKCGNAFIKTPAFNK